MKLRAWRGVLGFGVALAGLPAMAMAAEAIKSPATKPAPAAAAKKEEPMGKVEGIEVKRGDGYFGVALVNNNFKITFYDAKRHVVTAPVTRAVLHWPVHYKLIDERTMLNVADDGKSLTSPKGVKPPFVFKLFITFLEEGADEAAGTDSYVIDFRA